MVTSNEAGEAAYLKTTESPTPLDPALAAERLREVKRIFDDQGIVFWLGSGTSLGCIRENGFIPWDDEIDTASVIGMHGLREETIYRIADVFTKAGFYSRVRSNPLYMSVAFVRDGMRTDWTCHRIIDGGAIEFPGVKLPLHLFAQPTEVMFIGQKFLLPNPPEEYLRLKYGPEWRTPKGPGFEADVVMQVGDSNNLSRGRKLQRALSMGVFPRPNISVKVFDRDGQPVSEAEVIVAGLGRSKTNRQGIARFYVPSEATYAIVIRYKGHEEILYLEWLIPNTNYIYRPGPIVTPKEHYKAGVRAKALSRK